MDLVASRAYVISSCLLLTCENAGIGKVEPKVSCTNNIVTLIYFLIPYYYFSYSLVSCLIYLSLIFYFLYIKDSILVEDAQSGVQAGSRGHFGLVLGIDRGDNRYILFFLFLLFLLFFMLIFIFYVDFYFY